MSTKRHCITVSPDERTTVVCGAGLSHGAGVPLQAELAVAIVPDRMRLIHNITRGRPSTAPIDIEEFLTSIDFENLISTAHGDSKPLSSATYLQRLAIEIYNATAGTTAAPNLLEDYFAGIAPLWEVADTIITTNWDTLLECYARRAFDRLDLLGDRTTPKKLLKLHGSIDWFKIKRDQQSLLPKKHFQRIFGDYYRYKPFSEGQQLFHIYKSARTIIDGTLPAMIAPTHMKALPPGLLRKIWRSAYGLLQRADHLVIIGYSLPPSDRLIQELLAACRLPRFDAGGTHSARLSIIDPDPSGGVKLRYESLFGHEIEFVQSRFSDVDIMIK